MTQQTPPTLPGIHITQEQLDAISGGDCTAQDYVQILGELKTAYEDLVDFTSYVIERVAG